MNISLRKLVTEVSYMNLLRRVVRYCSAKSQELLATKSKELD
jgi:hypothetical protein